MATINGLRLYPETAIQNIATMIRRGNGTNNTYKLSQMPAAISALSNTGGDESVFLRVLNNYAAVLSSYSTGNYSRIKPYFLYSASFSSLTEVNFPYALEVGDYAFFGIGSLVSASFPTCKKIGRAAFAYCSSLTDINIPLVEYIGSTAFQSTKITSVYFSKCLSVGGIAFGTCANLSSVNLPVCEYIGNNVFGNTPSLTYVSLPKLKVIGSSAFYYCSSPFISSFTAPLCEIISDTGFFCASIINGSFPNCISIGYQGFNGCKNLENINISKCKYLSGIAFAGCSKLSSINLPVCTDIGASAFSQCWSLHTADLGAVS